MNRLTIDPSPGAQRATGPRQRADESSTRDASLVPAATDPSVAAAHLCSRLLAIWRELLKQPDLGPDTSFSEAGGDSLAAMMLLNTIEQRTGYRLQPRTLVTAPSVNEQVALIQRMDAVSIETGNLLAIPVQAGGDRPAQFIVPGYGDTLVGIRHLAAALGSDRPFYILDPATFDPAGRGFDSLAQLASDMVAQMRRISPTGPHHVCGHSIGAHLVWEIACQLREAGVKPGAVTLLDSDAPGYPHKVARPVRWAMKIAHAGRHGPSQLGALIRRRWQLGFRDLINLPPRIYNAQAMEQLGEVGRELERQWMATYRLASRYEARTFRGKVHLVRAAIRKVEIGARDDDPQLGWGRYAPDGVTVLPLDSDHWQILDSRHAVALAALLRQAMLA